MKCDGMTVFALLLVVFVVAIAKPHPAKDNRSAASNSGSVPCMEVADKE